MTLYYSFITHSKIETEDHWPRTNIYETACCLLCVPDAGYLLFLSGILPVANGKLAISGRLTKKRL
jgi:hypothetical protein